MSDLFNTGLAEVLSGLAKITASAGATLPAPSPGTNPPPVTQTPTPPTVPAQPIPASPRPSNIRADLRKPVALTDVTSAHRLITVGEGSKNFRTIQKAIEAAHAITDNVIPVIRIDPGEYVGVEAGPHRGYLKRSMIIESAVPEQMPRLAPKAENGKSAFTPMVDGEFSLNNLEIYDVRENKGGGRENLNALSSEPITGVVSLGGCLIYNNNQGVGRGGPGTRWIIVGSVFQGNGIAGEGYSHNIYVMGKSLLCAQLVSLASNTGHAVKSRCEETTIMGGILADLDGNGSYVIDTPDGGAVRIIGALVQNGKNSPNNATIHFGGEDPAAFHARSSLEINGVTMINDKNNGLGIVNGAVVDVPITITDLSVWGYAQDRIAQGLIFDPAQIKQLSARPTVI